MELMLLFGIVIVVSLGAAYWADHTCDGEDDPTDIKA